MVNIDCSTCPGLCCTSKTRAVLTPHEEEKFKEHSDTIKTKEGTINVLKQNEKGQCVFYSEEKNGCTIYEERPFECRMYPFAIYHENGNVTQRLDHRFCPNIKECTIDNVKEEQDKWAAQELPDQWIKAYTEIDNLF